MNDIFKYNTSEYDDPRNMDYLEQEYHLVRFNEALKLITEEIDKISPEKNVDLKLLSLGCGNGVLEEKIKKQTGLDIFGLDGSSECLKTAEKRGIKISLGDISKTFPFENNYFDFVFAGEIIEHLIDTRLFLEEVKRVLKPGGFLILTTPNLARVDDRIKFIFGKAPRQTSPMHKFLFLHIRPFTYGSLKDALEQTGFTIKSLRSNFIAVNIGNKTFKNRILAKLFPTLGGTLIVKAQKL